MQITNESFANGDGIVRLTQHVGVVCAEKPRRLSGYSYLISGAKPTLVDCGSFEDYPKLLRKLESTGIHPRDLTAVVITHGDVDHFGALAGLLSDNPMLAVYIHPDDWDGICEADAYRTAGYLFDSWVPTSLWIPNLRFVQDGDLIEAGNGMLEVVHTPGHTPGSICLLGRIDGVSFLFAGDTIGGFARCLPDGDLSQWLEANLIIWPQSLRKLLNYHFEAVLSGQIDRPTSKEELELGLPFFGKMINPWTTMGNTIEQNTNPSSGNLDDSHERANDLDSVRS